MTIQEAMNRLTNADGFWRESLHDHARAEPNDAYAERLRRTAEAAEKEHEACLAVAEEGLGLEPLTPEEVQPLPYELQRPSGRIGPDELWARFDEIHNAWMAAWLQRDMAVIADAFGQLSTVLYELADAVDAQRGVKAEKRRRASADSSS
jgi:hypothetical protein